MKERRPGELIRFYYIWKKTERYDMFLRANKEKADAAIANNVAMVNTANRINEMNVDTFSTLVFFRFRERI